LERDARQPVRPPRFRARGLLGRLALRRREVSNRSSGRRVASAAGRTQGASSPPSGGSEAAKRRAWGVVQWALVLVVATGLLAACSRQPQNVTTIRFWAMGREGEVVTALVPEFERTHPGIRVVVQQLPWTAAHEKLLTAFAGDSTPDIAQLGNTWIPEFVALGALDTRLAASSVERNDFFAGIFATNVISGVAYGVPWYVDTRLLFYRRDLLEAAGVALAPTSWAEWT